MKQGIQDNWQNNDNIKNYGCYFLCILQKAIFEGKLEIKHDVEIQEYYEAFIKSGYMKLDCFIQTPYLAYNLVAKEEVYKLLKVYTPAQVKERGLPKDTWHIACLVKPKYKHFVLHHINENGEIDDIWDSKNPNRPAAKTYILDGYRVFVK